MRTRSAALVAATLAALATSQCACTRASAPAGNEDPSPAASNDMNEPAAGKTTRPERKSRVVAVAAGGAHTCILTDAGAVRCWGLGAQGRLGYGNTQSIGDDEPARAAGDVDLGGRAVQISAGNEHTCALLNDNTARCWGNGADGRLGYGNTSDIGDDESPARAGPVPVGAPLAEIRAGHDFTCAVTSAGGIRCWGQGMHNTLGYGDNASIGDDELPEQRGDVALGQPATSLALVAGGCALLRSGNVRCWGPILGEKLAKLLPSAQTDVDLGGKATQIAGGYHHVCAVLEAGAVRCWGGGDAGVLGIADVLVHPYASRHHGADIKTPAQVGDLAVGGKVARVATGSDHTCALLTTGAVRCWGEGRLGALGYGNTENHGEFSEPGAGGDVPVGAAVTQIGAGAFHTCAVTAGGAVRCWGHGKDGRLGYDGEQSIGDRETPAQAGDVPLF